MLCQICQKNPAAVHVQEIANGRKRSLHLCLQCSSKKVLAGASMMSDSTLDSLLHALEHELNEMGIPHDIMNPAKDKTEKPAPPQACTVCSWTLQQYQKTGLLGCPGCYVAFSEAVKQKLPEQHHGICHTGKIPEPFFEKNRISMDGLSAKTKQAAPGESELDTLKILERDLEQSVKREEYELAAELRDKLAALRKNKEI